MGHHGKFMYLAICAKLTGNPYQYVESHRNMHRKYQTRVKSKLANIGINLQGNGESPAAPLYVDGEKTATLYGNNIAVEFQTIVGEHVARKYVKHVQ